MLVSMKEILDKANRENYAVAAPNVWSELDARAVIEAAEELKAPLIIDIAYPANPDLFLLGQICGYLAKKASIPIAVNLDHGNNKQQVLEAIRAGFTSIMYDCSAYEYEQNVNEVQKIVEIAHPLGLSVEAELGHVGMAEQYDLDRNKALTSPELAKDFVEKTKIDCLAVAIGTAHGAYVKGFKPYIDFERLIEIKRAVKIPLVLHGSSGTDLEDLSKVCHLGINKVNIANDLCKAVVEATQKADFGGNKAYDFSIVVKEAIKSKMIEMIKIYGSDFKA